METFLKNTRRWIYLDNLHVRIRTSRDKKVHMTS